MSKFRYHKLDAIRGLALVSMMAYHAAWDLVYLFGVDWPFYHTRGAFLWQQATCWTFILVSGFCAGMSRRGHRRGLLVFGCGWVITAVMAAFSPQSPNIFGVLVFLGSAMIVTHYARPLLDPIPPVPGLILSFILFTACRWMTRGYLGWGGLTLTLPDALYANHLTAYFGFPHAGFLSTDYFPLFPWLFLFLTGYFIHRFCEKQHRLRRFAGRPIPLLGFLGRHSLALYMAHQPVIFGLLWMGVHV